VIVCQQQQQQAQLAANKWLGKCHVPIDCLPIQAICSGRRRADYDCELGNCVLQDSIRDIAHAQQRLFKFQSEASLESLELARERPAPFDGAPDLFD
jgi:hypothetical protein